MPSSHKLLPQFKLVINLPIADDPQAIVLIAHRLTSQHREVNDAQSLMSQTEIAIDVETLIVRPPVAHTSSHPGEGLFFNFPLSI
jgi:hypothetical protein